MNKSEIPNATCIDIGANLANKRFKPDLEDVISHSKAVGLNAIVLTGSSEANSIESARLCEIDPGFLYSTAGVHPHDASEFESTRTTETLERLFQKTQVVAVGECGLDYNRDFSPREKQRSCFAAHLEMATNNGLPLFLHERDSFDDFYAMLKESRDGISNAVVHCFTGSEQEAEAYLNLDLHIGITGWICDERRGQHLRELVRMIPADRLMLETDCPYLAPRDFQPKIKRNEPKYLPHILQAVAECRGDNVASLGPLILETTRTFFGIA